MNLNKLILKQILPYISYYIRLPIISHNVLTYLVFEVHFWAANQLIPPRVIKVKLLSWSETEACQFHLAIHPYLETGMN